jgi:hypothetical protein
VVDLLLGPFAAAVVAAAVAGVHQWWGLRRALFGEAEARRALEEANHLLAITEDEKLWWPAFVTVPTDVWDKQSATLYRRLKEEEWLAIDKAFASLRWLNGWAAERRALAEHEAKKSALRDPLLPFAPGASESQGIKYTLANIRAALSKLRAGATERKRRWWKLTIWPIAILLVVIGVGVAAVSVVHHYESHPVGAKDIARALQRRLPSGVGDVVACERQARSSVHWTCTTADLRGSSCDSTAKAALAPTRSFARSLAADSTDCSAKAENDYDVIVDRFNRFMARLLAPPTTEGGNGYASKLPPDGPATVGRHHSLIFTFAAWRTTTPETSPRLSALGRCRAVDAHGR